MTVSGPRFLIVGTPRSGTTLLQRLTSELPGVAVTPETHFFPLLDRELGGVRDLPASRAGLAEWLVGYCRHPLTTGLGLNPDRVLARLPAEQVPPYAVFSAVVAELAAGVPVAGEKTPDHLRWWRPLTEADPALRIISLVRDPRAVAASMLQVPFGMDRPALVASQWLEDVRLVARARGALGDRLLGVRFEDMVTAPRRTQEQVAGFLGVAGPGDTAEGPPPDAGASLFPEWERQWKGRALEAVAPARIDAWRTTLTPSQVREVEAVAGGVLDEWDYTTHRTGPGRLAAKDRVRVAWHRSGRRRGQDRIEALRVGGTT